MILSNNKNFPIGLDISDLSLKLVQLKKSGDKIKFQAMSRIDLPKGLIEMGEIKNETEVIKKIKEITDKPKFGSITTNDVVASLPDSKSFIKLIEIEKSPNRLADTISSEIEKHVPISAKDIYFDWQMIEEKTDSYSVLIGAAPQNIVNQYIDLLNAADLSVVAMEIEPIAICRSLLAEENPKNKIKSDKNYAIIDIGSQRASMIIYSKNTIVMSISMPISGGKATEKIAQTLEIKNEQAEKAKIVCGLDKTKAQGIIGEILSDMLNDLNNRIKETIEFFLNHYSNYGPISQILICGGGSNIKNIDQYISQFNSIETILANPLNITDNSSDFLSSLTETHSLNSKLLKEEQNFNLSVKQNSGLSYATAIGLALRNIFIDQI
jgi:type IV pilus assembly protein PilM